MHSRTPSSGSKSFNESNTEKEETLVYIITFYLKYCYSNN